VTHDRRCVSGSLGNDRQRRPYQPHLVAIPDTLSVLSVILSMRHVLVAPCTSPNGIGDAKQIGRGGDANDPWVRRRVRTGRRRYHFLAGKSQLRKQPAQIVTNKRSPVVHVSTEVPRPLGEAFEDIARANGITKAELLRRLIQALVEKMKTRR
jgi:hypothetical protein